MAIKDELDTIADELDQLKAAIEIRKRMRDIYRRLKVLVEKVTYYQAEAGFDDIPPETKAALTRFYQMCRQVKTAFENDADFNPLIEVTAEPEVPVPPPT